MMPAGMIIGGIFHEFFTSLLPIIPYCIFVMLFITFSSLSLKDMRFSKVHFHLITVQIAGSILLYLLVSPFNAIIAQGLMMCMFTPTASSAPVITGLLGGKVASASAYSFLGNMSVALVAPLLFSFIGQHSDLPFWESFWVIMQRMLLLMVMPFVAAQIIRRFMPTVNKRIVAHTLLSFYLWLVTLAITAGITVGFILDQNDVDHVAELIIVSGALVICLSQFLVGRKIGRRYDDTVTGGQGLGQKNTILGIWMCQVFLDPVTAIAPGAYMLWQNIVNSYQVWRKHH